MLLKVIIIAIVSEVFLLQAMASGVNASCPHWVQLNKSPVCFGAKGNSFGKFSYDQNIFVSSFMLVHRSGRVSCSKTHQHYYSNWGCLANSPDIRVVLTNNENKKLFPSTSLHQYGGYTLPGYTSSSSIIVFCAGKEPQCVFANRELRLWYGEDFLDSTEADNGGTTCADVYGLLV